MPLVIGSPMGITQGRRPSRSAPVARVVNVESPQVLGEVVKKAGAWQVGRSRGNTNGIGWIWRVLVGRGGRRWEGVEEGLNPLYEVWLGRKCLLPRGLLEESQRQNFFHVLIAMRSVYGPLRREVVVRGSSI